MSVPTAVGLSASGSEYAVVVVEGSKSWAVLALGWLSPLLVMRRPRCRMWGWCDGAPDWFAVPPEVHSAVWG